MIENRPLPVFVLGLQRSGTTWMANLLSEHPQIASVQAVEHRGIHESIFFSHFARAYGDLADDATFERFVRHFTSSDYYLLTGLTKAWIEGRRPRSYAEAFRLVMDEVARTRRASCWIEKSPHHTLLCDELARLFPDARFLCVVRSDLGLARSRLWAYGRRPERNPARFLTLTRAVAANALYSRELHRFAQHCPRALLVSHEAMVEDLEREMRRAAAFLGLPFDTRLLRSRFAANSSFSSTQARSQALTWLDRAIVGLLGSAGRVVPLAWLDALERRRGRAGALDWPAWCWTRMPKPCDLPARPAASPGQCQDPGEPNLQPRI